eukprot:c28507_g2_i3 orf=434-607(+)
MKIGNYHSSSTQLQTSSNQVTKIGCHSAFDMAFQKLEHKQQVPRDHNSTKISCISHP